MTAITIPARRRRVAVIVLSVIVAVTLLTSVPAISGGSLSAWKAIILGATEGITEFLPISSTGHLLVVQRVLHLGTGSAKVAADAYAVAIQCGAILAVVTAYRSRLVQLGHGAFGRDQEGRTLLGRLLIAFVPAALVGGTLGSTIKDRLFGPWPVIIAWAIGGALLLVWRPRAGSKSIGEVSVRDAVIIGSAQVLALWPGASRSLVTLVAALLIGATLSAAVEFSFLLGLGTLTAATVFDLAKDGHTLVDAYGWRTPILGTLVAFVTAVLAVHWFIAYLRTRPLTIFGYYRLGAAAVAIVLVASGAI